MKERSPLPAFVGSSSSSFYRRRQRFSTKQQQQRTVVFSYGNDDIVLQPFLSPSLQALPPSFPSSALVTADSTSVGEVAAQTMSTTTFGPVMPSAETLLGMGAIVVLSVVASWVWANQVVPVSRSKLAIDKNRGELREYLDELREPGNDEELVGVASSSSMASNATAAAGATNANEEGVGVAVSADDAAAATATGRNRAFERWLFTDWLQDNKSAKSSGGGRRKEPALPILKDAKWNSGDNPVLVASSLIGLGVFVSSVVERAASLLSSSS